MSNEFSNFFPFIINNIEEIGIVAINKDGQVVDINDQACRFIFRRECQDAIEKNLFEILYAQERFKDYHERIRRVESIITEILDVPLHFELELPQPQESRNQFLRVILKAIRDKGQLLGFLIFIHDKTLEKEMELILRKSIDFKTSLLSVISHDMKNQLMVIQGFTDVLRKELQDHNNFNELEESLNGIDAKANQMQNIITDVRSYLKTIGTFGVTKELSTINLREVITESISGFESAKKHKNLEINVEWPRESKLFTRADLRLRSVFNNLLDNAIKWSPPNDVIEVVVTKENLFWRCSISDHGSGVPEGIKDEIFKPFISIGSKDKVGSGLGLSTSLEILQSYNSKIWIEDVEPKGARFIFRLPIAQNNELN
jgi:signal transduction histidine kinase